MTYHQYQVEEYKKEIEFLRELIKQHNDLGYENMANNYRNHLLFVQDKLIEVLLKGEE